MLKCQLLKQGVTHTKYLALTSPFSASHFLFLSDGWRIHPFSIRNFLLFPSSEKSTLFLLGKTAPFFGFSTLFLEAFHIQGSLMCLTRVLLARTGYDTNPNLTHCLFINGYLISLETLTLSHWDCSCSRLEEATIVYFPTASHHVA